MQVWENLDDEVIKKMKLSGLVNQRIKFPVELVDQKENIKYLVCRMYPEKFHYNSDQAVEAYYDRVLSGEITRFKKGFFTKDDESGKDRAAICLRRALNLTADFQARRQCMIFSVPQKEDHLSVRINWRAHAGIYSSSLYVSCIILFIQSSKGAEEPFSVSILQKILRRDKFKAETQIQKAGEIYCIMRLLFLSFYIGNMPFI